MSYWQPDLLNTVRSILEPDQTVLALMVYGSFAAGSHDEWSDLDLLVVTENLAQTPLYPDLQWLQSIGEIFTADRWAGEWSKLARIVFDDLRRVDLLITDETGLQEIDKWPSLSFADPSERKVIFSRSPVLDETLARSLPKPAYLPPSASDLDQMADAFWHKCALALAKLARDDRLIAFHLTLAAIQDCCVMAMILRDREKQTNHHRFGGFGNEHLDTLRGIGASPVGIVSALQDAAGLFDDLALRCIDGYTGRADKFAALCAKVTPHMALLN